MYVDFGRNEKVGARHGGSVSLRILSLLRKLNDFQKSLALVLAHVTAGLNNRLAPARLNSQQPVEKCATGSAQYILKSALVRNSALAKPVAHIESALTKPANSDHTATRR